MFIIKIFSPISRWCNKCRALKYRYWTHCVQNQTPNMDQQAFNPNNTLGALSIGVTISIFLYGVLFMQTYVYHKTFPNDSPRLKALVSVKIITSAANFEISLFSSWMHRSLLLCNPKLILRWYFAESELAFSAQLYGNCPPTLYNPFHILAHNYKLRESRLPGPTPEYGHRCCHL